MDAHHSAVAEVFGTGNPPAPRDLVVWDGMDQLDKEGAYAFFQGKRWEEVLVYLRGLRAAGSAAYFLDEWVVMSQNAIAYYARAYFEYLFETVCSENPNDEFLVNLFSQLYQLAYMHKGSLPLDAAQVHVIIAISRATAVTVAERGLSSDWEHDIEEQVERFLRELETYEG